MTDEERKLTDEQIKQYKLLEEARLRYNAAYAALFAFKRKQKEDEYAEKGWVPGALVEGTMPEEKDIHSFDKNKYAQWKRGGKDHGRFGVYMGFKSDGFGGLEIDIRKVDRNMGPSNYPYPFSNLYTWHRVTTVKVEE